MEGIRNHLTQHKIAVTVINPGFIDTPIKEHMKLLSGIDREQAMAEFPFKLHPQDYCAEVILHGVERNRAIITVTALARFMWLWYRYSPRSYQLAMNRVVGDNPLLREASS